MKKYPLSIIIVIILLASAFLFILPNNQAYAAPDTLTLRPNGAGDVTQLTKNGAGGANWDRVDEVVADNDATYVSDAAGSDKYDLYTLSNHTIESGTINSITVYLVGRGVGGNVNAYAKIKTGGTEYTGDIEYLAPSYETESHTWGTNPKTSAAWTWDDIDALQVGVRLKGTFYAQYCTQVYVEVDYTSVVAPTVTTQETSSIEDTTATGNGNVTNTGGENVTIRGIVWDLASHGAPGNVAPAASGYANDIHEHGSWSTGAFTIALTGLPTGTTIYARAYAYNSGGYGYGDEVNFLTKPAAPTGVTASDGTYTTKVKVDWTKSTGATGYRVYEGINLLDTLGDVATYDDTAAPAGSISSAGTASATDGASSSYVSLSLVGEATTNGASRTYKVVAFNATGDSADSVTDTGYRGVGAITYQWQRSAADSDASYGNISGAITDPYNDTNGVYTPDGRYYQCVISATDASNTPQTSTNDRGYKSIGAPTVTTQATTDVEETTATGNGNITATGGENCDIRGVEWGLSTGSYIANVIETGNYGTGAFIAGLIGLPEGTTIYCRSLAHNTGGWGYGGEVVFYTKPGTPSGLADSTSTNITISMSWVKGVGAEKTMVRYRIDTYPTGITDGTQAYYDTGTSVNIGSLSAGTKYYMRAWAWDTNSGYSDNYVQDLAYTTPNAPINLVATVEGSYVIRFTFTKGDGSDITVIRYKEGSYPSSPSDGASVYEGTGTSIRSNVFLSETTYLFMAWGKDSESGYYSVGTANISATTTASTGKNIIVSVLPVGLAVVVVILLLITMIKDGIFDIIMFIGTLASGIVTYYASNIVIGILMRLV